MGPEGSLISLSQLGQFRGRAVEGSDWVWGTGSGKEEGPSQGPELMSKAGSWRAGNKAQPRRPVNIGRNKLKSESYKSFYKSSHITGRSRVESGQ